MSRYGVYAADNCKIRQAKKTPAGASSEREGLKGVGDKADTLSHKREACLDARSKGGSYQTGNYWPPATISQVRRRLSSACCATHTLPHDADTAWRRSEYRRRAWYHSHLPSPWLSVRTSVSFPRWRTDIHSLIQTRPSLAWTSLLLQSDP